jgi:hypothetical protein
VLRESRVDAKRAPDRPTATHDVRMNDVVHGHCDTQFEKVADELAEEIAGSPQRSIGTAGQWNHLTVDRFREIGTW